VTLATTIHEAIIAAPGDDALTIARRLLARLTKPELLGLLVEEVEHSIRANVREIEVRAFHDRHAGGLAEVAFSAAFKTLLDQPVRLGDATGGLTFGALTSEQHRQRIAMLSKLRDGLDATIVRHREAIEMIEAAGVGCLNELQQVA
jgi:phosphoribosylformylglycinamidine (FGAM) synthase-like enzyme